MLRTAKVKIEGISPLLFNRFIEANIGGGEGGGVKTRNANQPDPADKLYKIDGKIYTPSTHIYGTLVEASKNFQVIGQKRSTYSKIMGSTIEVEPDAIVHKYQDWEVFSISAVNPATRGRIMTHRPMMKKWELEFDIIFDDDDIPKEVLKSALDYAGRRVGIGDWRPSKKGKYGKFIVTEFKVA